MSEELKPCPNCGHTKLEIIEWEENPPASYVRCDYCGLQTGPTNEFSPDVITEWNALPRRFRWTKEKPTKNGWYWWRTGGDCNLRGIVSVCIETDIMVLAGSYKYLSQTTGEWAGPIPEPEEK